MRRTGLLLSLCCAALPACSSDAVPEPEPQIETPGAFIAVDEGAPHLALYRTISTLRLQDDLLLYLTPYDVQPATWEEARELSKQDELPLQTELVSASRRLFPSGPHEVVWYRSLTEEEKARIE